MNTYSVTIHVPGTLAADKSIVFTVPFNCQLIHVSACGSPAAHDAIMTIGTTTTADAYLLATTIGVSNVPQVFDRDNFVGTQFPHIAAGTVMAVALDFNGSAGTAIANWTCILTFTLG